MKCKRQQEGHLPIIWGMMCLTISPAIFDDAPWASFHKKLLLMIGLYFVGINEFRITFYVVLVLGQKLRPTDS